MGGTGHPGRDAGSIFAPRLGLHVHVALEHGALARLRIERHPLSTPPSGEATRLLARVGRHLETGRDDFRDVPLSLAGVSDFDREVLTTLVREVGPGEVVTYAELARMLGRDAGAARAIGGAMARNPIPIVVPCHRVVPAGNRVGNYSGEGGWDTKMKLLRIEGARGVWTQAQLGA